MTITATKNSKTINESYTRNFWRLFHCFLRHSNTEEENTRSRETWQWILDNDISLRKACTDYQLSLIGIIWDLSFENRDLPGYDLVLEKVQEAEKNDSIIDALKEYKKHASTLNVHDAKNLPSVFRDLADDWEKKRVMSLLKVTSDIVNGNIEEGKNKWSGARDAVHYLMKGLEKGVLIGETFGTHPIDVRNEAEDVNEYYHEQARLGFIESGFDQFHMKQNDFVGILGYAGDGKSTTCRYILYNIALSGKQVIYITFENSSVVERNKFILLHAHNPKFGNEFNSLTYDKFINARLTAEELEQLKIVAKDFKETVQGNIIIHQPLMASWEQCKSFIEMQDMIQPVDVVGVDYLQMIDPPNSKTDNDARSKFSAMAKDVRQYSLTFKGNRGLTIISPVQSNETGKEQAAKKEGVWTLSGINNEKELGRSMTFIIGVFSNGITRLDTHGDTRSMTFSCVKERDGIGFQPFFTNLTMAGYILPDHRKGPNPVVDIEALSDIVDDTIASGFPL